MHGAHIKTLQRLLTDMSVLKLMDKTYHLMIDINVTTTCAPYAYSTWHAHMRWLDGGDSTSNKPWQSM